MNGRIFDPTLGAMLQGDPFIQDATNLQNFNRYSYCLNNPLTCTDPSGFN
jgi:RHS repeat-associated protein